MISVFVVIKLDEVQPATHGHNIVVKVIEKKLVLDKTRTNGEELRIAECLVGDETATALFTARNGMKKVHGSIRDIWEDRIRCSHLAVSNVNSKGRNLRSQTMIDKRRMAVEEKFYFDPRRRLTLGFFRVFLSSPFLSVLTLRLTSTPCIMAGP